MTESNQDPRLVSLQAQLASVIAAMNMHMVRAEELVAEKERIMDEIAAIQEAPKP